MAMPQRDDTIEAIKRLDALLEYAVMHGGEEEAARLREELRKLMPMTSTTGVADILLLGLPRRTGGLCFR